MAKGKDAVQKIEEDMDVAKKKVMMAELMMELGAEAVAEVAKSSGIGLAKTRRKSEDVKKVAAEKCNAVGQRLAFILQQKASGKISPDAWAEIRSVVSEYAVAFDNETDPAGGWPSIPAWGKKKTK